MFFPSRFAALLVLFMASVAHAAMPQLKYLSGLGKDDPVPWQFLCDKGQHCGIWSTIGVPSNWELQGFGTYGYGRVRPEGGFSRVHGKYKRTFTTPEKWTGQVIFIHFEGVMTDTQVTVNGQSAGPRHQGGYYAFKYNITSLLKPAGQQNKIEVDVDDESSNESVNHAERRGDFWNYGGIFRPVYLEAVPETYIDHLAVKASAAGLLDIDVRLSDLRKTAPNDTGNVSVRMQVLDLDGHAVGLPTTSHEVNLSKPLHLSGTLANPRLWTAETPNLYQVEVSLRVGKVIVHSVRQKFGFRTVELRPGQGLFVNGKRVFLKGVARHSFWPDSGRTLSQQISREDIALIKEMNGNAVRSTHYPPDSHFLDACDELGLYVLDELTGWQAHYDTDVGRKLVEEMVEHDVNHPSILFWDNGNEGGFNFDLDGEFSRYDPQNRTVLHPWAAYPLGIADTKHYPNYTTLLQKLTEDPVFFPTEMLHGLYDGGAGAGLSDYWDAILKSKAGAGGFIWAFLDEDVKRTDKGGILDSQGNMAPDGIVGPYREREGSFYTLRQLWSPIVVIAPNPTSHSYTVLNRYSFIDAKENTFVWQAIAFRKTGEPGSGSIVLASRTDHGRSLAPGLSAVWNNWGPPVLSGRNSGRSRDANRLLISDRTGSLIATYVWPVQDLQRPLSGQAKPLLAARPGPTQSETDAVLTATAGDLSVQISKASGLLVSASRQSHPFSLINGPRVVAKAPREEPSQQPKTASSSTTVAVSLARPAPALQPESKLTSLTHEMVGEDLVISAVFDGPMKSVRYRLHPSSWLTIEYVYTITGPQEYFGVGFSYPEAAVKGVRYLGEGPSPVYQNRLAGGVLDVWDRPYNNTVVGNPDGLKPGKHFEYPPFKGFYSGVRWLQLNTAEGPITVMVDQQSDSPIYVQVFAPKAPPSNQAGQTLVPFPGSDLSFLHAIPAIGSKFGGPKSMGPMGQPSTGKGEYKGQISLYFGKLALP